MLLCVPKIRFDLVYLMALFLPNKGYWPPLKQRADGAYTDGVPERDLLQLSPVHEGGFGTYIFEYYLITPKEAGLRRITA